MKRAALHNLGCKVNAYETEAMQQMLEEAGYQIVPFTETADVYVINTCSVTGIADRKSRQMLHRARSKNPDAIVVAAGCYVQTGEEQMRKDAAVDIIIGNNRKNELISSIRECERKRKECRLGDRAAGGEEASAAKEPDMRVEKIVDINEGARPYEDMFRSHTSEHTRAFLKVQDGCNQFCSYCIIPYARGRARSRSIESVVAEVSRLAESGCREVVLTGIHLSSYGSDIGEELPGLIQKVHQVEGIDRIRLGSLEPQVVTERFAAELAALPKVCPHFHLSLQSGSDVTLKRMNRRYTVAEYERGCAILRSAFLHPAITTDVIVGFPGETQEEFARTREFLERIRFYEMHVFKYSKRQGTRAAVMPDQVPEPVKAERSAELIALSGEMSREFRDHYIGSEQEVLFEEQAEVAGSEYYVGYTREYVKTARKSRTNLANQVIRGIVRGAITPEIYLIE